MTLWRLSAREMHLGYAAGSFTPVDVLQSCLARLETVEPNINAMTAVLPEQALQAAQASASRYARGQPASPLDGVPLSIKDNILTSDAPTTWGTPALAQYVGKFDEEAVVRVRNAGMVVLGKTNLCEFTLEGYSANPLFGATRNPWNLDRTPGGSSGGAAASVAAGVTPLALGTDTGGSIRRPSSHCGIVGFKPSLGSVARDHALPTISLDFDVIGPMARSVSDVIDLFNIVAGPSPMDWRSWGPSNAMLGAQHICRPTRKIFYCAGIEDFPVDREIGAQCEASLAIFRSLGFCVDSGQLPFPLRFTTDKWPTVGQVGLSWLFREYPEWGARASEKYRDIARAGADQSAADLLQLLHETDLLRRDVAAFFSDYDYIVTPATASLPWEIGVDYPSIINEIPVGPRGHAIFSAWVNACGIPAIALPAGMSADNLPLGIQLIGPYGSDAHLLRLARQYELSRSVEYQCPDLAVTI